MILMINAPGLCKSEKDFLGNRGPREMLKLTARYASYNWNLLPTSAAIVVNHLRSAGYPVRFYDMVNSISYRLSKQLEDDDFFSWLLFDSKTPLMEEYLSRAFRILPGDFEKIELILISVCHVDRYPYALSLAKELNNRFPNIPICFGGTYITTSTHNFPGYVTYLIKGHGGGPVCHLAGHVLNHSPLDTSIPGLYINPDPKPPGLIKNQAPADLEAIPDFSGLNLKNYLAYNLHPLFFDKKPDQPFLSLEYRTSMGCSNKCSFCSGKFVDNLQFKSPAKVVADLEQMSEIAEKHSNGHFCVTMVDLAINHSLEKMDQLLDALIASKIKIKWYSYAKVRDMPMDILKKLPLAGCRGLFWGFEAATNKMLNVYNKPFTVEQGEDLVIKIAQLNIYNIVSLIYNGPGETEEDFQELLSFIRRLSRYKRYMLIRPSEFSLSDVSEINYNPELYNIEVFWRKELPYSINRQFGDWKEKGADWDKVRKQREIRTKRVKNLIKQIWIV